MAEGKGHTNEAAVDLANSMMTYAAKRDAEGFVPKFTLEGADIDVVAAAILRGSAVEGLVKALEDARLLILGPSSGDGSFIDERHKRIIAIESALTRFREAQAGGGA